MENVHEDHISKEYEEGRWNNVSDCEDVEESETKPTIITSVEETSSLDQDTDESESEYCYGSEYYYESDSGVLPSPDYESDVDKNFIQQQETQIKVDDDNRRSTIQISVKQEIEEESHRLSERAHEDHSKKTEGFYDFFLN